MVNRHEPRRIKHTQPVALHQIIGYRGSKISRTQFQKSQIDPNPHGDTHVQPINSRETSRTLNNLKNTTDDCKYLKLSTHPRRFHGQPVIFREATRILNNLKVSPPPPQRLFTHTWQPYHPRTLNNIKYGSALPSLLPYSLQTEV